MPVAAAAALYVCYGCWRGGGVGGGVSRRNAGIKGPDDSSRQAMHLRDSIPPIMKGGGRGHTRTTTSWLLESQAW